MPNALFENLLLREALRLYADDARPDDAGEKAREALDLTETLELPEGWFVLRIGELVKPVNYRGDQHENDGGFFCELQYRDGGGKATKATGPTLSAAYKGAIAAVKLQWPDTIP